LIVLFFVLSVFFMGGCSSGGGAGGGGGAARAGPPGGGGGGSKTRIMVSLKMFKTRHHYFLPLAFRVQILRRVSTAFSYMVSPLLLRGILLSTGIGAQRG